MLILALYIRNTEDIDIAMSDMLVNNARFKEKESNGRISFLNKSHY